MAGKTAAMIAAGAVFWTTLMIPATAAPVDADAALRRHRSGCGDLTAWRGVGCVVSWGRFSFHHEHGQCLARQDQLPQRAGRLADIDFS